MNILIVGANSLLSQELIKLINRQNLHKAYGLCNISTNNCTQEAVYLNFSDLKGLAEPMDVVVLVASYIPYGKWDQIEKKLIETNVIFPRQISELYPEAHFVFCSSVSVYGSKETIISEDSEINPSNPYAMSKLKGEEIAQSHKRFDVVRFSSIIGPKIESPTFIPRAIEQAKNDQEIIVYGEGSRRQNYVHVREAAEYLFRCIHQNENGLYLGVGKKSWSNLEIAQMIQDELPETRITFKGEDSSNSSIFDPTFSRGKLKIQFSDEMSKTIHELIHGR